MPEQRSARWYEGSDRDAYIHRAWMRRGLPEHAFDGRPHIAIANSASDLTPCNGHLDEVAEHVKRGVWEAGGVPLNLPVVSLGETQVKPTAMLWRNMAAMAIEEMLRANPIDGVVLLGGCDKTIPSLLMAACSVDLPALVVPGGPMLTGTLRGAARPTPSSTCSRSPADWVFRSPWPTSTASGPASRCWSTCSRRVATSWRTSSGPVACTRCWPRWPTCSTPEPSRSPARRCCPS